MFDKDDPIRHEGNDRLLKVWTDEVAWIPDRPPHVLKWLVKDPKEPYRRIDRLSGHYRIPIPSPLFSRLTFITLSLFPQRALSPTPDTSFTHPNRWYEADDGTALYYEPVGYRDTQEMKRAMYLMGMLEPIEYRRREWKERH